MSSPHKYHTYINTYVHNRFEKGRYYGNKTDDLQVFLCTKVEDDHVWFRKVKDTVKGDVYGFDAPAILAVKEKGDLNEDGISASDDDFRIKDKVIINDRYDVLREGEVVGCGTRNIYVKHHTLITTKIFTR